MDYQIYKMMFPAGIHLGKKSLDSGQSFFCADTLFSALCIEALKFGTDELQWLVEEAKTGRLLISDAFPFTGSRFFVPKPHLLIEKNAGGEQPDKKSMKDLAYIPADGFGKYIEGNLNIQETERELSGLGTFYSQTSAAVRGNKETLPYSVGAYRFADGCGLYIIVGFCNDESIARIETLLESLQYSGIGGRRTEGLGQFVLYKEKNMPGELESRLKIDSNRYISLSVGLPRDTEMEQSMRNARYKVVKRSGFVASADYSDSYQRKKDLFVFAAGSCFENRFEGDVYDVSGFGSHPVYRYAKPVFMGVD